MIWRKRLAYRTLVRSALRMLLVGDLTFSVSVQPFGAEDAIANCLVEFFSWVGVFDVAGIVSLYEERWREGERRRRQTKGWELVLMCGSSL
jgi:hypothetical protein